MVSRSTKPLVAEPGMPADGGLFGPDSVTWRIMREPVLWVGGVRALYLQALHPRVMRGTWQNTVFTDPSQAWDRFLRTTEFVRMRTYGTIPEVERAGRRLRKIHSSLTGTDEDGQQFRLDEPELLMWVHCGEIDSYVDIARRSRMPLSAADLDTFVAEQRSSAAIVGLDPATAPCSTRELDEYMDRMRPRLRACDEAKKALLLSYSPKLKLPAELLALKLLLPSLNTLAFTSLPRWARKLYGTPGSPVTDIAATVALRAAYESTSRIPPKVLYLPMNAAARRRGRPLAA